MHSRFISIAFLTSTVALFPLSAGAASVTTDPVGVVTLDLLGNSDTIVSLPLHRTQVFQGQIEAVNGSDLTLAGDPSWNSDEFAPDEETYYVLIASGSKEGMYYTVTSNSGDTLSLDLAGDSLGSVQSNAADGDGMGDFVKLIPYWTLDSLFPNGEGFISSSQVGAPVMSLLVFDDSGGGINLSSSASYFLYGGGPPFGSAGWRSSGDPFTDAGNTPLVPDRYFAIRNRSDLTETVAVVGKVQMTKFATVLHVPGGNMRQDNLIGLSVPVPLTLNQLNLVESGFLPSTSPGSPTETLLLFDNSSPDINRAAAGSYFYYAGGPPFGDAGWRSTGDPFSDVGSSIEIQPGQGFVIRKAGAEEPTSWIWDLLPAYLE